MLGTAQIATRTHTLCPYTSLFRSDYAAAADGGKALPGADADYNRGNALARAGRYEDAIKAYDQALVQQPDMADAIANRKLVEAAMKRKPPPSQQSGGRG